MVYMNEVLSRPDPAVFEDSYSSSELCQLRSRNSRTINIGSCTSKVLRISMAPYLPVMLVAATARVDSNRSIIANVMAADFPELLEPFDELSRYVSFELTDTALAMTCELPNSEMLRQLCIPRRSHTATILANAQIKPPIVTSAPKIAALILTAPTVAARLVVSAFS